MLLKVHIVLLHLEPDFYLLMYRIKQAGESHEQITLKLHTARKGFDNPPTPDGTRGPDSVPRFAQSRLICASQML